MHTNKALVGLVVALGVAILLAVLALVYGFVQKAADPSFRFFALTAPAPAKNSGKSEPASNITVPLPLGTSVVSVVQSGDLLMVHTVDEDDSSAVLFIDPNDGRIVRRIAFGGRR